MSSTKLDLNFLPEEGNVGHRTDGYDYIGSIYKEHLIVSPVAVRHLPISLPPILRFSTLSHASLCPLKDLPSFELIPYQLPPPVPDRRGEWKNFTTFLFERDKVARIPIDGWELIIKPPDSIPDERTLLRVCYRKLSGSTASAQRRAPISRPHGRDMSRPRGEVLDPPVGGYGAGVYGMIRNVGPRPVEHVTESTRHSTGFVPVTPTSLVQPRLGLMHPSYLSTLAQTHASWLFGGLAELVDNARDAGASRLSISITNVKMKGKTDVIPMLRVADNGKGMTHADIVRMLSFGHSTPTGEDQDQIGHFGVGFKTGSMRIGKDVVVLTQSENSRSIGLLSVSYNADKQVLEIPIVTYRKVHGIMEMDFSVQSEAEGTACLEAVKKYSPFGEFEIGSMFEKIGNGDSKNGTHIFIYNLDVWGQDYALQWDSEDSSSKDLKHRHKDITIRSKRVRTRPGQTSREIPLDYSLRSYLEVLFLEPRMIIAIQGSKVKSTRLAVSLNTTRTRQGKVLGKQVELTLGISSVEVKRGNCGIFLYWHGRLIEAYKRVGGMVHSADMGRGVIGVIDVTPLMENGEGRIGVLNTKQGFEDSEEYALLEKWLGQEFNQYWFKHFENLEVVDTRADEFEPDKEWVQCDKCQKWRKLPRGVHTLDLPDDWFCYMEPFGKTCKEPEERAEEDIVTVAVNRTSVPATVLTPKEENLEDREIEAAQSPIVPARRQSMKNVRPKDLNTSQSSLHTIAMTPMTQDGKRQGSESPKRRRLRKRN